MGGWSKDVPRSAGLVVIGAVVVLAVLRRAFAGVSVSAGVGT